MFKKRLDDMEAVLKAAGIPPERLEEAKLRVRDRLSLTKPVDRLIKATSEPSPMAEEPSVRREATLVPAAKDGREHRGGNGRRIVVFIDGTANTPEELEHVNEHTLTAPPPITNVTRLMRGVPTDDDVTNKPQVIGYFRGVGTEGSATTRILDGMSGHGLSRLVLEAYRFISHNLEWSGENVRMWRDQIYIFGFSRGAYAARALTGFLDRLGLLRKAALWMLPFFFAEYQKLLYEGRDFDPRVRRLWDDNVHQEYRSIPVHFLGVWDTVGALGVPVRGLGWVARESERFHNTKLTKNVTHAYQALAIHELRWQFKPVFWTEKAQAVQTVEQVWFAGAHSNVGGGYREVGLSGYALDWMAYHAHAAGLEIDKNYFTSEIGACNSGEHLAYSRHRKHDGRRMKLWPGAIERPVALSEIDKYLDEHFGGARMSPDVRSGIAAHWSVQDRLNTSISYTADSERFQRLDEASAQLRVVPRSVHL